MGKALIEILGSSSLCHGLTQAQIEQLASGNVVKVISYKRNDILFWTDRTPDRLLMLISGKVVMAKDTLSGKRSLSRSNAEPGLLLNDVRLFSGKKLLWDYCVALEDSEVLEMDSAILLRRDVAMPDIQLALLRNIITNVVEKIDYQGQKVRILSIPSARGRIALYLLSIQDEHRRMALKSTREELADYLGLARPSLSRELGRMQDDGIIRIDGREVFILDQAAFDELLE